MYYRGVRARRRWAGLRVNLWFVPAILALVGGALALGLYYLVEGLIPGDALAGSGWVLSGSPEELRAALLAIAATILGTAGIVFSLLTLPLSTVAAQYGSRLLRVFLGDRTTQMVMGVFVGTFVFCLVAALSIPDTDAEMAAAQVVATVGLLLMLASFASLILLIQHIATMLQAPNIVAAAAAELRDVVQSVASVTEGGKTEAFRLFPPPSGVEPPPDAFTAQDGYPIRAENSGYIQAIDPEYVSAALIASDLVLHLLGRPGYFVRSGEVIALVRPAERVTAKLAMRIGRAFEVGNLRTPTQDSQYAVNQLTEVAVRAMSPAINDPFTAMTCLDHLGDGLTLYVQGARPSPFGYDRDGHLRLIYQPFTLETLLDSAFDMLRHASCDNAAVLMHMLDTFEVIGRAMDLPDDRRKLARHAELVRAESRAGHLIDADLQAIEARCAAVVARLETV